MAPPLVLEADTDVFGGDSVAALTAELTAPMQAGAVRQVVRGTAAGGLAVYDVPWQQRHPVLLLRCEHALEDEELVVTVEVRLDGAAHGTYVASFAPFTERGGLAFLLAPPADPTSGAAAPATLRVEADRIASGGAAVALLPEEVSDAISLVVLEGVLGKMLVMLGAEHPRLRRQSIATRHARRLDTAHGAALDRIGADLRVDRLTSRLELHGGELVTSAVREGDASYRQRLAIYRPFMMPTRSLLAGRLNGPGDDGDPNAGLPSRRGVAARFTVTEVDDTFAFAVCTLATSAALRDEFHDHLRDVHLVDVDAVVVPAHRMLPPAVHAARGALRQRLRDAVDMPAGTRLAPQLAAGVDRLTRVASALGIDLGLRITRGYDAEGGSRYELGLGADVSPLAADTLDDLAAAAANQARAITDDEQAELLIRSLRPVSPVDDPDGRWLLEPAGLWTAHRLSDTSTYVSHLPNFGLRIDRQGPLADASVVDIGQRAILRAHYPAPGEDASNVALARGVRRAAAAWAAAGGAPWTTEDAGTVDGQLDAFQPVPEPAATALAGMGWRADAVDPTFAQRFRRLPPELVAAIRLAPADVTTLAAGGDAAGELVEQLAAALRSSGLASVVPAQAPGGAIVLLVGVLGLPSAGVNLAASRTAGFRWYAPPLTRPDEGEIAHPALRGAVGSINFFTANRPGVWAVVVSGYARGDLTDPYEIRVDLPDGERLDVDQYEYVMNLLDHHHPLGIEVNTWRLRHHHLDRALTWSPSNQRMFRSYRKDRP